MGKPDDRPATGDNRRKVRQQTRQRLAQIKTIDEALDLEPLPQPQASHDREHPPASALRSPAEQRRWRSRHWRQPMWKRRDRFNQEQAAHAEAFWSSAS